VAKRRIAILVHENVTERMLRPYVITQLAECWRMDGYEVLFLTGTSSFVAADLIIVHVDLSMVPESYLEFAGHYPIALNSRVRDIRKSTFATNLLQQGDPYDGPVIVKSDYNFAGIPERKFARPDHRALWTDRLRRKAEQLRSLTFVGPRDYRIYDCLDQVPRRHFNDPGLVVQKFQPEMDQGMYCVRSLYFLGDSLACVRPKGPHPIVNGETFKSVGRVEPAPEILIMRQRLGFDYGKFDYVVTGGGPVLLDINKTPGARPGGFTDTPEMRALQRELAKGLEAYFLPHAASS